MSKLHKSKRRLVKPKESAKVKGEGLGKAAGILGLVGQAVGIASSLKKGPKVQKQKQKIEPVAGRVQKPLMSMKKPNNMSMGDGKLAKIAALGGLAYLFFGNKKK